MTAILTTSIVCITPATLQNYWMLNIQFASFWASPAYFSGFSSFILELIRVPGPIVAGGAGGTGSGADVCYDAIYAACHHLITSLIRSCHLRRSQWNMSDLVIQVLISKLRNCRYISLYYKTRITCNSSKRIQTLLKPVESLQQASVTWQRF